MQFVSNFLPTSLNLTRISSLMRCALEGILWVPWGLLWSTLGRSTHQVVMQRGGGLGVLNEPCKLGRDRNLEATTIAQGTALTSECAVSTVKITEVR
ncbi:hypothetical protein BDN67DRAFT_668384 [Paxillus ammoniavirescens]|nr:hypothetical protein BDN67DRAFT_668384 [Paxillus ammoniavirescens]